MSTMKNDVPKEVRRAVSLSFLWGRRTARMLSDALDSTYEHIRENRRCLRKLEAQMVLSPEYRKFIERHIAIHRADQLRFREMQLENGKRLATIFQSMDAYLTDQERCDLLNINQAHRTWDDGVPDTMQLVFALNLEDSASRADADYAEGALWDACQAFFLNWMRTSPKGQWVSDHMFAPGGPFDGVPLQRREMDGTVTELTSAETIPVPPGAIFH